MAESLSSDIQLEIAHVLFIDIVGYSKLLIDEQRELQQQLNQIVRNTDQFRTAETAGNLCGVPPATAWRWSSSLTRSAPE